MTYTNPPNVKNHLEGGNLYQGFPLHLPVDAGVSTAELGCKSFDIFLVLGSTSNLTHISPPVFRQLAYSIPNIPSGSSPPISHSPQAGTSHILTHPGYHDPRYEQGGPLRSDSDDPFFSPSNTSSEGASPASWAYPSWRN
jgi:hypothetical protein